MTARHATLAHPLTGQPLQPVGYGKRGPIWPILGASEDHDDPGPVDDTDQADEDAEQGDDESGTDALGDAGKQALDRMKEQRNAARAEARAFKALGKSPEEIKALLEAQQGTPETPDPEAIKAEGRREAIAEANARILRSEIKAAATGKVAPDMIADLPKLLDLSALKVDADGNVDEDEIAEAIDALLKSKPSLAAQREQRFKGSADGGTRKGSAKSIDDQIAEATAAGNHALAISLKRQKAYAATP